MYIMPNSEILFSAWENTSEYRKAYMYIDWMINTVRGSMTEGYKIMNSEPFYFFVMQGKGT